MSSFKDFLPWTKKVAPVPIEVTNGTIGIFHLGNTGLDWTSQETQYGNGYCLNAYVARACNLYAVRLSSVDHIVYNNNGDDITENNHPFIELMNNPNPHMTRRDFFHLIGLYLGIYGEAFVYPKRSATGYEGLYVLDPKMITEMVDSMDMINPVQYWKITKPIGGTNQLLPDEVIHIKMPDPDQTKVRGLSPMVACSKSIEMQNVIREWNIATTNNGAKPSTVIESEDYLTKEQVDILKADIRTGYQGQRNAGNAMLLPKGLHATSLGMTAVEMDYQKGMVVAAREIAISYGIPPEMLADNANKTYSNAQEASREVVVNTVRPLLDLVYQSIWAYFRDKPIASGIKEYTYDVEQLTDFMGVQTELYTALQQANFLTVNDKRKKLGYDPIDDPLADQVMMSMADVPMSEYSSDPLDPGARNPEMDDLNTLLGGIGL